jgi:hypothetical protein
MNSKDLLGAPITSNYEPPDLALSAHFFHPNRPFFTVWHIDAMLVDARVIFGLLMLRGPILTNSRFLVKTNNQLLKQFLIDQINRFWTTSAGLALRFMDYGFVGAEILYRAKDNSLQFDKLKYLHPHNTRAVTRHGKVIGMEVGRVGNAQSVFVGAPKCFWTVHNRDQNQWYGRSRLRGAFLAWNEIWSDHGYRDQRRVWFYKNAYAGPKVGYPPGSAPIERVGDSPRPHREIAQEMVDKMVTGTGVCFPTTSADQQGGWVIEDAKPISIPEGLLEYGDQLRDEIWEGMGVPPEVARADGDAGAFAGRRVPQQAFYSSLQEIVQELLTDLDDQILRPLSFMRFGRAADYELECLGLMRTDPQEDKQSQEERPGEPLMTGLVFNEEETTHNLPADTIMFRATSAA